MPMKHIKGDYKTEKKRRNLQNPFIYIKPFEVIQIIAVAQIVI